ncbi:MAG: FAD-binding oxidoreductase [Halobacteriales archaeon]
MTERETSHWGWGYVDSMPSEGERRRLADLLESYLGFPERPALDLPSVDDADLPAADVEPPFDWASGDRESRIRHTYGCGYRDLVRGFHGDFSPAPDVVLRPRDEDDVRTALDWASREGVAVVPYGGGTSVVGGVECEGEGYAGVASLDLRGLDRVIEVDEVSRAARIQAGARGPEIQRALDDHGLHLRHYPQSYVHSTLGGWLATHAGGHYATIYTHVDDFVESVRMQTPVGEVGTSRLPRSGAGPYADGLLLGSEGAFGVFTEAWMRVEPRPRRRAKATVEFEDFGSAVAAVRDVARSDLYPANCRLLDRNEALLNQVGGRPRLILGFESVDGVVESRLERAVELVETRGGDVDDVSLDVDGDGGPGGDEEDEPGSDWRSSFFEGPYLFNALVSLGVVVDTFETSVVWRDFPEFHADVRQRLESEMERVCGAGFVSCRFTHVYRDGPAPYYTFLAPADAGSEIEQWRALKETAMDVLADHGAATTHHHAVGRVHRSHLDREVPGRLLEVMRSMKRTLDPEGVMNPGVLLPGDEA